jgi:putative PIN family toxin of toxin-antitoxin system
VPGFQLPRVVIDTNVVFEGLTKQGSACGLIIDAWNAGLIEVCISTAMAYEYEDVLSRKRSKQRWQALKPVLGILFRSVSLTKIYFSWRSASPDAGDDLVIDCAMNDNAVVVTSNICDFQQAKESLGLRVITPVEFVTRLAFEEGKL